MNALAKDLRYALRSLYRNPTFSLVAVATLALGIGVNTAIFGLVRAVLLRPLDVPEADRLALVYETNPGKGWDRFSVAPANYLDWKAQARSFQSLAAVELGNFNVRAGDHPERIQGARVTAELFPMLSIPPLMGRVFSSAEDSPGAPHVVILGEGLWRERFGADERILGDDVWLDGVPHTVIGVMPARLRLFGARLWVPMAWDAARKQVRGGHDPLVMGRLAPGVTAEGAQHEMTVLADSLARRYPETNAGWGVLVSPLFEETVGDVRRSLLILLGAAGFVLLIACANVANLLLVRGAARAQELAIRAALGGSRGRLVRQLLTESLLLSLIGGAAGLLVAIWGIDLLSSLRGLGVPRSGETRIDLLVLAVALGSTLLTGLLFGLAPALRGSRTTLHGAWKGGDRVATGRDTLRNVVIVGEVGLALVLLIGAGLFFRSLERLGHVDPGFRSENLLTMRLSLPPARYPEERLAAFYEQLLDKVVHLPSVRAVAASSALPLTSPQFFAFFIDKEPSPKPADVPSANWEAVNAGYFRTMGIPVVAGREFTDRDREGAVRVAVINQTMARGFFPRGAAIGRRIRVGGADAPPIEIVGIVADIKHNGPQEGTFPQVYEPLLEVPSSRMGLALRSDGDVQQLTDAVRRQVASMDADLPIFDVSTMSGSFARSLAPQRSYTILLVVFASLALSLAMIGIYGVISYAVAQRTHEIGIRVALGAARGDILRLVVGHGMRLLACGLVLGLVAAFALTRLLRAMLFGVSPVDLPTYAALSFLLTAVTVVACYLPARRAARVDPAVALRCE